MKKIYIYLFPLLFSACQADLSTVDAPRDLIEREAMVDLMTEIVKLEGLVEYSRPGVNQFHSSMLQSADSLFKAHRVTREQYDRSMEYYGALHAELEDMYDEVLERLGKEIGELESN